MIDTHYDLLSIAYVAYLKNDYSYIEKISKYFNDKNVLGLIANLYFMSLDEMREELHPDYYKDDVSVLEMFKISKKIVEKYFPNIDILYSIEGADYISGPDELEQLYNEGLDSLIMCWNTKSKYASGLRSDIGLTELGRKLLYKQIDLGLGVDLSHANKECFYDMISIIKKEKEKGKDICVYASHSNSKILCNRQRNLDDEQLKAIRGVGGLVGVFALKSFIVDEEEKDIASCEEKYLEHIDYIGSIIGFDNVMTATDDMDFCKDVDPVYGENSIYKYKDIANNLKNQLNRKYSYEISCNIMYNNAKEKIINKIRSKRNNMKRGEE